MIWYISAMIYAVGGLVFEVLGTAKPQEWAVVGTDSDSEKDETNVCLKEQNV